MMNKVELIPVQGLPSINPGDNLPLIISQALEQNNLTLNQNDILVIAHKIVSISEKRLVNIQEVKAGKEANLMAKKCKKDPKLIQLILDNAKDVLRINKDFLITRDFNGIVAANSGIDQSNYMQKDFAVLLPKNSNKSAKKISVDIKKSLNKDVSVIITDSVGRPWRNGLTQIALGSFGIPSIIRYKKDLYNRTLFDTDIPIADELCSTAGILMIKDKGIPVVIIRGYNYTFIKQGLRNIIRSEQNDIFK